MVLQLTHTASSSSAVLTLQPGNVSGAFGAGNLNKLLFSIMFSRWLMSRAFFWIWFTRDSNLAMACTHITWTVTYMQSSCHSPAYRHVCIWTMFIIIIIIIILIIIIIKNNFKVHFDANTSSKSKHCTNKKEKNHIKDKCSYKCTEFWHTCMKRYSSKHILPCTPNIHSCFSYIHRHRIHKAGLFHMYTCTCPCSRLPVAIISKIRWIKLPNIL